MASLLSVITNILIFTAVGDHSGRTRGASTPVDVTGQRFTQLCCPLFGPFVPRRKFPNLRLGVAGHTHLKSYSAR